MTVAPLYQYELIYNLKNRFPGQEAGYFYRLGNNGSQRGPFSTEEAAREAAAAALATRPTFQITDNSYCRAFPSRPSGYYYQMDADSMQRWRGPFPTEGDARIAANGNISI